MRKILETIFDNEESDVIMTEEQVTLDKELRVLLQEEALNIYLKLIDSLLSSRVDAEKEQYKKGFRDGIRLKREIEEFVNAPID